MNGDALHLMFADFDLAGMKTAADLDAERTDRFRNGLGATHGARRTIEGSEKPIAKRFHLVAAGVRKLSPDDRMMSVQKIAPALVAQLLGAGGRVDDIGEEHRREDAVASRHGDRAGQEFRDRVSRSCRPYARE